MRIVAFFVYTADLFEVMPGNDAGDAFLCALSGRYSTCLYHPQINHCTQQLVLLIYLPQAPAYFRGKPYASYPSYVDVSRCVAPIQ